MTTLTCDEVEPQLELFAAGECDAAAESAIAAHLSGCAGCTDAAAEARTLLGLLTLRHREQASLQRFRQAVEAESETRPITLPLRRPSRLLVFTRRVSAAAALFLCVVGAWSLLGALQPPSDGVGVVGVQAVGILDVQVAEVGGQVRKAVRDKVAEALIAPHPAAAAKAAYGCQFLLPSKNTVQDYLRNHACVAGRWTFLDKDGNRFVGTLSDPSGNVPPAYPTAAERIRVIGPINVVTASPVPDLQIWRGRVILEQPDATVRFGTPQSLIGDYRLLGYEANPGKGEPLFKNRPELEFKGNKR
jgi:hypothetical protein